MADAATPVEGAVQADVVDAGVSTTATLPIEVWERIMTHIGAGQMHTIAQVSRQHLAITQSVFFRARYFMVVCMPCQAMYHASSRPKLFTPELIKCLLSQGAIMSRYFVQSLLQRTLGVGRMRSNIKWATTLSSSVVTAVLVEGQALYGDSLKYSVSQTDGSDVKFWTESNVRMSVLSDNVREIFVKGRFSLFSDDDICFQGLYMLSDALAQHPELLKIMTENGYEYSTADQDRIVSCILAKYRTDEEELYRQLDALLTQFTDWHMSATAAGAIELIHAPNATSFSPTPIGEQGRALQVESDGAGLIKPTFKVMKRLYDEGRAFLDMDSAVHTVMSQIAGDHYRRPSDNAAALCILSKTFPPSLEQIKSYVALSYVCAFEQDRGEKRGGQTQTASDVASGHAALFKLIQEAGLSPDSFLKLLSSDQFGYDKLIPYVVKANILADYGFTDKRKFLFKLMVACLYRPMAGHKLEEIEVAMKEVFASEKRQAKRTKRACEAFANELSAALLEWEFDLETLKPDRRQAVESKLRTPIAWMTKGSYRREVTGHHFHYSTYPDIHGLFPNFGRTRYGNETIEFTFTSIRRSNDSEGEGEEAARKPIQGKEESKPAPAEETCGWQHLGHIDDLAKADDSGVMLIDRKEPDPEEEPAAESSTAPKRRTTPAKKAAPFATFSMRVLRSHCSGCLRGERNCCGGHLPFHPKAKDLALALPLYLAPTSSALRDVVLAHALVNGNDEVVRALMSGTLKQEAGEGGVSTQTFLSAVSSSRLGSPDQPVLPTLAHLRILQAIERKPVPVFVDALAKGAPFKRGFVKSALRCRAKEREWELRDQWNEATVDRDDRRQSSLFAEKKRLESIDKAARAPVTRRGTSKAKLKQGKHRKEAGGEETFNPTAAEAAIVAAGQNCPVSTRSHLSRTARKPVRYSETISHSSDDDDDGDVECQDSGLADKKERQGMHDDGIFGEGSDLSDPSEDVECNDSIAAGESETEDELEGDEEDEDSVADDAPEVKVQLEDEEVSMPLEEMQRRCTSLGLWLEHLRLLQWFERRKERLAKEKAQKARGDRQQWERVLKSRFASALGDMIKRLEALEDILAATLKVEVRMRTIALRKKKEEKAAEAAAAALAATQSQSRPKKRQAKTQVQSSQTGGAADRLDETSGSEDKVRVTTEEATAEVVVCVHPSSLEPPHKRRKRGDNMQADTGSRKKKAPSKRKT